MILKDVPGPDIFDFDLAITIWKHLTAARKTGSLEPGALGRRFIYFPDPTVLPTPGKCTVKPFKEVLESRTQRQLKKAALRKKLNQTSPDSSVEDSTLAVAVFELEELDNIEEALEGFQTEALDDQESEINDEILNDE